MPTIPFGLGSQQQILTPEQMGVPDLLSAVSKGLELGYKPKQLSEQLLAQQLKNQISRTEAQYAQRLKESQLANEASQRNLYGAQTQHYGAQTQGLNIENKYLPEKLRLANEASRFKNDNPLLYASGAVGDIGGLMYLQQHPELMGEPPQEPLSRNQQNESLIPSIYPRKETPKINYQELLKNKILSGFENNKSAASATSEMKAENHYYDMLNKYGAEDDRTKHAKAAWDKISFGKDTHFEEQKSKDLKEYRDRSLNQNLWFKSTPDSRANTIALGQGAGIPSHETERWMAEGKDFNELLYNHGYDKNNPPDPIYQLTGANRTQYNNRVYAGKEMEYISNFVNKSTGDYANRIADYSIDQIMDGLKGKNKEKQAQYLAGVALSPELVNLRILYSGGKSTVHSQKKVAEKSMLNFKTKLPFQDADVWRRAQEIQNQELEKAFKYSSKGFGQAKLSPKSTLENKVSVLVAPEIPDTVNNDEDFTKWMNSLSRPQQEAVIKKYGSK